MKPRKEAQIVVRVNQETVERAQRLQAQAERAGFTVTISSIYRRALEHGLRVMERKARTRR